MTTTILGLLSIEFFALYALWIVQGIARLAFHAIRGRINRRY
jgi:hypothetical protein